MLTVWFTALMIMSSNNIPRLVLFSQVRISSWPKEVPGTWFSEFKRGKIVSLPSLSFHPPPSVRCTGQKLLHSVLNWMDRSISVPVRGTLRNGKQLLIDPNSSATHEIVRQWPKVAPHKEIPNCIMVCSRMCFYQEHLFVKIIYIPFWTGSSSSLVVITILRPFYIKKRREASIKHHRGFTPRRFSIPVVLALPLNS